jgi:hypothetical protein
MIKNALLFLFAAAATAQPVPAGGLGPHCIMSGRGGVLSGIRIEFAAYAIPGGKWDAAYAGGGISAGGDTIHRSVVEAGIRRCFGP